MIADDDDWEWGWGIGKIIQYRTPRLLEGEGGNTKIQSHPNPYVPLNHQKFGVKFYNLGCGPKAQGLKPTTIPVCVMGMPPRCLICWLAAVAVAAGEPACRFLVTNVPRDDCAAAPDFVRRISGWTIEYDCAPGMRSGSPSSPPTAGRSRCSSAPSTMRRRTSSRRWTRL